MTNNTDIIARIEKLEKKNKQLRLMLFAVVGLFLVGGIVAFQSGHQFFKEIKTEKLTIVDQNGKQKIVLYADPDNNFDSNAKFYNSDNSIGLEIGSSSVGYLIINDGYVKIDDSNSKVFFSSQLLSFSIRDSNKLALSSKGINDHPSISLYGNSDISALDLFLCDDIPLIELQDLPNKQGENFEYNRITPRGIYLKMHEDQYLNFGQQYLFLGDKSILTSGPLISFGTGDFDVPFFLDFDKESKTCSMQLKDFLNNKRMYLCPSELNLFDDKTPRASLNNSSNLYFSLFDRAGNSRIVIGQTSTVSNGRTISHPESSIYLFNENGNGLWSAP